MPLAFPTSNGMNPFTLSHNTKALLTFLLFGGAGIVSWLIVVPGFYRFLPLAIFYGVLVINTYFSVRFFSAIISASDKEQQFIDALLVLLYFATAFTMNNAYHFLFSAILLFIVASMKYALLIPVLPHRELLRRKILWDLFGALSLAVALRIVFAGYEEIALWALAIGFTLVNIYLLLIKPLYRLQ